MAMFSKEEIRDIAISVAVISVIFAYPIFELQIIAESFLIVVVAFLFHELAHKFVAKKFGSQAYFKTWPMGLVFAIFLTVASGGFLKFVAPGAVMISPYKFGRWKFARRHITFSEVGIIAMSGPLVNIIFALIFSLFPGAFFARMVFINAWLAFINLLPIKPLDGSKIFGWKMWAWFMMIVVAFILVFVV